MDALPKTPGFIISVSQNGLNYLRDVGIPILESQLQNIQIDPISGKIGSPIGDIDYELKNIVVDSVSLSGSSAAITSTGVSVSISGVTAKIKLDWEYKESDWPHVSDSGSADISTTGTTASASAGLINSKGSPQLQVQSVSVNIGSLDIQLHGGASWLYQLFVNAFSGDIKSSVQDALKSAISDAISGSANKALKTLPTIEPISTNPPIEIDYELIGNPVTKPNAYIALPGLGEFYNTKDPTESPYTPGNLPIGATTEMVQLIMDDYVFESAGYVLFTEEQLRIDVTPSDIPKDSPLSLNTSSFALVIPALYREYPDYDMELHIEASSPPTFTASSDGYASVVDNGTIEVFVINSTDKIPVFTLGAEVFCSGNATISGQNIQGELTYLKANIWLISTEIGSFSVFTLQFAVDLLIGKGVIPMANKVLEKGFPLPSIQGVTFQDPTVAYDDGYIVVSTNIVYHS